MPRPTRFFALILPSAGRKLFSCIAIIQFSVGLLYGQHVAYLVDHAANRWSIFHFDALVHTAQAEALQAQLVFWQ